MIKWYYFILMLFVIPNVKGQSTFSKSFNIITKSGFDNPSKFSKCSDDGYVFVVTGSSNGMQVVKTDSAANIEWSREFDGQYYFGAITEKSNGGYWIATSKLDTNYNYFQTMFSLDSIGSLEWVKGYEDPNHFSTAVKVIELNNSVLLIGDKTDTLTNKRKFTTTKTDFNGNVIWQKTYDDTLNIEVRDAMKIGDNEILIAGIDWQWGMGNVLKIDSTGNILWRKGYKDTVHWAVEPLDLDTCVNGDIIVTGRSTYATWDIMAMRLTSNGDIVWGKQFRNNTADDEGYSIHENQDGTLIICAEPESYNVLGSQTALLKLDSNGSLQWFNILQPNQNSFPFSSIQNSDGSLTIFGMQGSWGADTAEVSLIRTSPTFSTNCDQQSVTTTEINISVTPLNYSNVSTFSQTTPVTVSAKSISIESIDICTNTGLSENNLSKQLIIHPNPTNGLIQLPKKYKIMIISDNSGRIHLIKKDSASIDISNLNPGIYYLQVSNDNDTRTAKIILE